MQCSAEGLGPEHQALVCGGVWPKLVGLCGGLVLSLLPIYNLFKLQI